MSRTSNVPPFQSLRVLAALMVREMITRYGRSWGGYLWAVLEPVGMIAVLSIAFSQFVRTPPIGESFILFYASGYVPFHFFSETSGNTSAAITVNRPLMQFPMVTPLDTVFARFFLSVLTLIVVSLIVFSGIFLVISEPIRLSLAPLVVSMAGAALVGLGVGTLNSVLFPFVPVWRRIWNIINRPLFIISGVFFTFESMPRAIQEILWWNPLVHVIGLARKGFYPTYDGDYISLLYLYGFGLATFLTGAWLLARHRSYVVEND